MTICNPGEAMLLAASTKDPVETFKQIEVFRDNMRDPLVGAEYVAWITTPCNLTLIHTSLIVNLSIPPKLMSIRRMVMSRTQRAVFLLKAIEAAVKRVHGISLSVKPLDL